MNKTELGEAIAERTRLPLNTVLRVIDMTEDVITDEVRSGNNVLLTGFLKFEAVDLPARERRNPSTGGTVVKLPERVVRVRPMARFKRDVAGTS